ncbi:MAG: sialate O-acetylesterase [Phycisphaerae bacterium]
MQFALAPVFTDHMVLQQGLPVPIWGSAAPDAAIRVTFGTQRLSTKADPKGHWKIALSPLDASSKPAELVVTAAQSGGPETRLVCKDVLVGEVWIGSGQSNMEWPVSLSNDGAAEMAAANHPQIRLFTVPKRIASQPETDIPGGLGWLVCGPETVAPFSAVAYFFGRELHRRLGVPVGLINSSYGGTPAEAWTSREGILGEPGVRSIVEDYERNLPQLKNWQEEYQREFKALDDKTRDTVNLGLARGWAGPAEPTGAEGGEWKDMPLPGKWQARNLNFSGILWFRKTVEVPAEWAGQDLQLSIGATDKSDVTYFNGTQVGSLTMQERQDAWSVLRTYTVPGKLVKAGRTVIAVRVHSDKYDGGMTGPSKVMNLSCPTSKNTTRIPLDGTWRYAVEANYGLVKIPVAPPGPDNPNTPCCLFNGMITPLLPYALRGAIWYQGESNADRARQHRILFPTLIKDWRRHWGLENLGFYFVQLANYMVTFDQPTESQWAELRESQTQTLSVPHTGMAVAIDIGEANDIHPRNKQDVGLRLALSALYQTYGRKEIVPSGPLLREWKREGQTVRVSFNYAAGGLVCRGAEVRGFAVAGPDGNFVWAKAVITDADVIVSSPTVPDPQAVRYAWADNPDCNLYNQAGLPAVPFQTNAK